VGKIIHDTFEVGDLRAVDVIASTLYRWKPEALKALLDLEKEDFHWIYHNEQGFQTYVKRSGSIVKVSMK